MKETARTKKQMSKIASALSSAAGRYQARHGGELPRLLGVKLNDKTLTEDEERKAWSAIEARAGFAARGGIERRTPASELEDKEEEMGIREPEPLALFPGINGTHATVFDDLAAKTAAANAESEEAACIWLEANAWLLDFLFAEGPHPGRVMRRLYAWVKKFRPEAIWDMGYRQLALLLDESHAAIEWRVGVLLDDYARAKGIEGVKAPWQRTAEACQKYAEVQKGNANRLGGKRAGKHKARKKKK